MRRLACFSFSTENYYHGPLACTICYVMAMALVLLLILDHQAADSIYAFYSETFPHTPRVQKDTNTSALRQNPKWCDLLMWPFYAQIKYSLVCLDEDEDDRRMESCLELFN